MKIKIKIHFSFKTLILFLSHLRWTEINFKVNKLVNILNIYILEQGNLNMYWNLFETILETGLNFHKHL
jgi:hypothetical protein